MWNNDDPGWPTLNKEEYNPWREARQNSFIFSHRQREEDAKRTPRAPDPVLGGIMILLLLIGGSALVGMRGLLAAQGVQALLLSTIGLCWLLGRRQRAGWRWLYRQGRRGGLLLFLVSATLLITGCADTMKGLAKTMYNVDYDAMQSPQPRKAK